MPSTTFYVVTATIVVFPVDFTQQRVEDNQPPPGGGWLARIDIDPDPGNGRSIRISPPGERFFSSEEEAYDAAERTLKRRYPNPVRA
jgi:hypothetical protein